MKKLLLFLTLFSIQFIYGQQNNELHRMLKESILDYNSWFNDSTYLKSHERKLYLCIDGLPARWRSKEFYDSIPMEILSWENPKQYSKEMKKGLVLIEVSCSISGDATEIHIFEYYITRKGKRIFHGLREGCIYTYQYNYETKEWIRQKIDRWGI